MPTFTRSLFGLKILGKKIYDKLFGLIWQKNPGTGRGGGSGGGSPGVWWGVPWFIKEKPPVPLWLQYSEAHPISTSEVQATIKPSARHLLHRGLFQKG